MKGQLKNNKIKNVWLGAVSFRYYQRICLEGLRKTTATFSGRRSPSRVLNLQPAEYGMEVINTVPRRSLLFVPDIKEVTVNRITFVFEDSLFTLLRATT